MSLEDSKVETYGRCVPFSYIEGFLRFVWENLDTITIITYADLNLDVDPDWTNHYESEYTNWRKRVSAAELDPTKIYLLIQHDVDRDPERTHAALQLEGDLGLRSNVMLFNKKLDRHLLRQTGEVQYTPYPIDYGMLQHFERNGFVVGYHSNAVEQARFDFEEAKQIFRRDVRALQEHFRIRHFSPHGGVRDAMGRSNAHLDPPRDLMNELRWVQNRFTVRFAGTFSDGAIAGVKRDPEGRDLRNFVARWEPGKRYRVLLHPQYYGEDFTKSRMLSRAQWYVDICERARRYPSYNPWENVSLLSVSGM
jgi:hypothetical protein